MKKANVTTGILAMAIIALMATSCKDKNKEQENQEGQLQEDQLHEVVPAETYSEEEGYMGCCRGR